MKEVTQPPPPVINCGGQSGASPSVGIISILSTKQRYLLRSSSAFLPNFQSLFVKIFTLIIYPVSESDSRLCVVSLRYNILVLHYYVQSINLVPSSLPMLHLF